MNPEIILGFGLVILGAVFGGTFALPSKFAGEFPWETLWGAFFLFVTLLIPLPLCCFLLPDVLAMWEAAGWPSVLLPAFFGFLWGLGSFTNGIAISLIGLSLSYAINFGVQTSVGSLLPFVAQSRGCLDTPQGKVILAGIALCVAGVAACGYAGILKERGKSGERAAGVSRPRNGKGIIICVISGILCACLNLAFSAGARIQQIAVNDFGKEAAAATLAVWLPAFIGGCVSAGGYCLWLLIKKGTWRTFVKPGAWKVLALAALMAFLHDGALFFYGAGTSHIGVLGTSVGFAVFASGIMVVGNVSGFVTREWRGVKKTVVVKMIAGIALIVLGICVLARGNAMSEIESQRSVKRGGVR